MKTYEDRVQALEDEGLNRSDAQGVVEAEDRRSVRGRNIINTTSGGETMKQKDTTPQQEKDAILEALRKTNPEIAITVAWELDPDFVWDGDGEDPMESGLHPYSVKVTASKIIDGELQTEDNYLGGCYSEFEGPHCPLIHGYLAQMIEEAVEELSKATS